ncbi:unnamed protein product [Parnassius apollo]|uniref:(apollo) hypothetical protein n=1 Tax=Parnassius apollo TaxID=110799 RepID=A0A8S3Y5K7_PARAO|nr:unnamed protein product [Parnassius apollo]
MLQPLLWRVSEKTPVKRKKLQFSQKPLVSKQTAVKSKISRSVIESVENTLENKKYWLKSSSAVDDKESCQDSNMSENLHIKSFGENSSKKKIYCDFSR